MDLLGSITKGFTIAKEKHKQLRRIAKSKKFKIVTSTAVRISDNLENSLLKGY